MKKTEYALPPHISNALFRVLSYLWHDEGNDFQSAPLNGRKRHIYQALTLLSRWRLNPSGEPDYFGDCPKCKHGGNDGCLNIGRDHWFVCHVHGLKWCAGENLFGLWRHESKKEWEENYRLIEAYKEIPIPVKS